MGTGVFCASSASQGYIGVYVREQRSTAAALYLTVYYIGGGVGAVLPAAVWSRAGWPGTVALILIVQACACVLARTVWPAPPRREGQRVVRPTA
jgi:predicted MFS family arabinose efflux permease